MILWLRNWRNSRARLQMLWDRMQEMETAHAEYRKRTEERLDAIDAELVAQEQRHTADIAQMQAQQAGPRSGTRPFQLMRAAAEAGARAAIPRG